MQELKSVGIFPSMFPMHTFYWGDWYKQIIGPERAAKISPMRSILKLTIEPAKINAIVVLETIKEAKTVYARAQMSRCALTLDHRLRSIEAKRTRLIEFVSAIGPARLAAHPRPGKWSIQEIVEHLVLSEVGVLGDFAQLGRQTPLPRRTRDRVLYLVVMFILRFNIPVRVPSPAISPTGGLSLANIRVQWEANHDRLRAWVATSDQSLLARPLFRHPVAGPMTTAQSLRMLEVHLDRHVRQIDALVTLMNGARPA